MTTLGKPFDTPKIFVAASNNKVSGKSKLNTICRLKPRAMFSIKLRDSFKGKYFFRHLTRVLVRFPETKGI